MGWRRGRTCCTCHSKTEKQARFNRHPQWWSVGLWHAYHSLSKERATTSPRVNQVKEEQSLSLCNNFPVHYSVSCTWIYVNVTYRTETLLEENGEKKGGNVWTSSPKQTTGQAEKALAPNTKLKENSSNKNIKNIRTKNGKKILKKQPPPPPPKKKRRRRKNYPKIISNQHQQITQHETTHKNNSTGLPPREKNQLNASHPPAQADKKSAVADLSAVNGLLQTTLPLQGLQPDAVPTPLQVQGHELQRLALRAARAWRPQVLQALAQLQHGGHDARVRLDVLLERLQQSNNSGG